MTRIILLVAVQSVVPPLHWTTTFDRTGHCMYAVPPEWRDARQGEPVALMHAPDGAATVEQTWSPVHDWSAFVVHIRHVLRPTVVHESTAQRLWLEYAAGWPGLHYYVAVPSAGGVCIGIVDVTSQPSPDLRALLAQIISTIAAAN